MLGVLPWKIGKYLLNDVKELREFARYPSDSNTDVKNFGKLCLLSTDGLLLSGLLTNDRSLMGGAVPVAIGGIYVYLLGLTSQRRP